jgi:hydroxymethylpyrimidine pyrophosphatase-like HAD family hydrolase
VEREIKPLGKMPDEVVSKIKMVVFDVDGVVIPKGTEIRENGEGTELIVKTKGLSRAFVKDVTALKRHVRVAFSSGRSLLYLRSLVKDFFDKSVILQTENGAIGFLDGRIIHPEYPNDYFELLYKIKNLVLDNAKELKLEAFEPKLFILTVHLEEKNELMDKIVNSIDKKGILYCVWGGEAYDIGLACVTKGQMLRDIAKKLDLKRDEVLTMGNAMNDKEMLEFGVGVTVEPDVVWGQYKTSGKRLGGEEVAEFLVKKFGKK